jgi:ATP-dependent Clp protease ATP-binding subunit ClpA
LLGLAGNHPHLPAFRDFVRRSKGVDIHSLVCQLDRLCFSSDKSDQLSDSFAETLEDALRIANTEGAPKILPVHLLKALMQSTDPSLMLLFERLEFSPFTESDVNASPSHQLDSARRAEEAQLDFTLTASGTGQVNDSDLDIAFKIALREAKSYSEQRIGGEFLVLALLKAPGNAAKALTDVGIEEEALIEILDRIFRRIRVHSRYRPQNDVYFDHQVHTALLNGLRLARLSRSLYIGTDHYLLALIERKDRGVLSVLSMLQIEPKTLVAAIEKLNPDIPKIRP